MKILESLLAVPGSSRPRRRTVNQEQHGSAATAETNNAASRAPQVTETTPPRPRIRDKVDVSKKVEVFSSALELARRTPEIRASLVQEMRELVTTGQFGRDVHRLANRLIDSVDALATEQLRARKPSHLAPRH